MSPWGRGIICLNNARANEAGRAGSEVSERWTLSWMLGLWCGALGYNIEIPKLLPEVTVSLCWLHLHLALLLLLLQLLGFPNYNRKERGSSMRALAAADQHQNCAALEKKVGTWWESMYSIPDTLVFQEPWQSNKPKQFALKALHLDKAQDFLSNQEATISRVLPTMQKAKALVWMLSG